MSGDVEPAEAVGRVNAAAKNRKAHPNNRLRIASEAVDDDAGAASIAGSRGKQFAPKTPIAA